MAGPSGFLWREEQRQLLQLSPGKMTALAEALRGGQTLFGEQPQARTQRDRGRTECAMEADGSADK